MKKVRRQPALFYDYGLSPEALRLPLDRLQLNSPPSQPRQKPHKSYGRSESNPLLLAVAIDEAQRIRKRVQQIRAFNQYCRERRISKCERPTSNRNESKSVEKALVALCGKLTNMEEFIEQQRKCNDDLREKLQSQEFESADNINRQVGHFTKPSSRGMVSTHRDTDNLNESRAMEEIDSKNRIGRHQDLTKRTLVETKQRGYTQHQPAGGATDRPRGSNEQLQRLHQQFQHLILQQEVPNTQSKQQRALRRNELIEVSRRIKELSNCKTHTYHL